MDAPAEPCWRRALHLQVWDVTTGAVLLELGVKSVNKEAWPLLHWGAGDEAVYHGVTNTVHQYSKASGFKSTSPQMHVAGRTAVQQIQHCRQQPMQWHQDYIASVHKRTASTRLTRLQ